MNNAGLSLASYFTSDQLVTLSKKNIKTPIDLLLYLPRRYIDRSTVLDFRTVRIGETITFLGKIVTANVLYGRRRRLTLKVKIDHGFVEVVYFQGVSYLSRLFYEGREVAFSGKLESYRGKLTVTHPEHEFLEKEELMHTGKIVPVYKIPDSFRTKYITGKLIREVNFKLIREMKLTDYLASSEYQLYSLQDAIKAAHFPESSEQLKHAIERLAFDELVVFQHQLAKKKLKRQEKPRVITLQKTGLAETDAILGDLPFKLTADQANAVEQIRKQAMQGTPLNILLQGDVGSGKTVVAMASMLDALHNGGQAVLMAPTEILARQHFQNFQKFLYKNPFIQLELLVGGEKARERQAKIERIARGETGLLIGTHALLQPDISFHKLSFIVIDEQHRFGVEQRKKLVQKSKNGDLLAMSATPIPRSLTLAIYGDMDTIQIKSKPAGRKPIDTRIFPEDRLEALYRSVKKYVDQGRQAYIIYPLIDESENSRFSALLAEYSQLETEFFANYRLGLLHGRLKDQEKDAAMVKFQQGLIQILVSTTVVEVGVDVPNATVMIIRNADKFGLSQLHQLRGRVGRGEHQSFCILVESENSTTDGKERLQILSQTEDGFLLAQRDFEMRGSGEVFGHRQAGGSEFTIADLRLHGHLAIKAAEYIEQNKKDSDQSVLKPSTTRLSHLYKAVNPQIASQPIKTL